MVNDSIENFYSTQLISEGLLSKETFSTMIDGVINDFQLNLFQLMQQSFSFVSMFTGAYRFSSFASGTSFSLIFPSQEPDKNHCVCLELTMCYTFTILEDLNYDSDLVNRILSNVTDDAQPITEYNH